MKKALLACACFLCYTAAIAQLNHPIVEVMLAGGYQSTNLNWSIAGNSNGQSPNIYSELKWENINAININPQVCLNITDRLFIAASYNRSYIHSGHVSDNDYAGNERQMQTYSAYLDSDEGHLTGLDINAGYTIIRFSAKIKLSVLAGYVNNKENLLLLNHEDDVPGQKNLRSTYQTSWGGVMTGLDIDYQLNKKIFLSSSLKYGQLKYTASADWNLIDAFQHPVSFKQHADGFSLTPELSATYLLTNHLALKAIGNFTYAVTGKGIDNLYLESGETRDTQFNGATKHSTNLSFGILFRY